MNIVGTLLKTKYFDCESKERLEAKMISLLILLPGIVLLADIYESAKYGFSESLYLELAATAVLGIAYLLFPRFISVKFMSHLVVIVYVTYILSTLFVPDQNYELTLFWLAVLPIPLFYLLGKRMGKYWTIVIVTVLAVITLASHLNYLDIPYSHSLMIELTLSFLIVSYIIYVMESQRQTYATRLQHSLDKNKMLFKEMHHRTKNNMQLIMSLLETQAFRSEDKKVKKIFQAYVDRIKAMSFVHENLYKHSERNIANQEVDMHKYLGEVLSNLQQITRHTIITDIDYITLDIKHSMSVGLIVNEAVSNAIEHAYSVEGGRIDVSFKHMGKYYELEVKDYGTGFNKNKVFDSLGLGLIEDLSASLPDGVLHFDTQGGTLVRVTFSAEKERR